MQRRGADTRRGLMRFGTAAALVVVAVMACQQGSTPVKPVATSASVLILTASNHLQSLSLSTEKVQWDVALGGDQQSNFTAHLMTFTTDKKRLAVLARGSTSQVVPIDPTTGRQLTRHLLPAGLVYRGLDIGPKSGRVYVFGNRELGPDRGPTEGPPSDAVVTEMAPDLSLLATQTVRPSAGFDWFVYEGATDASESHLLVSYHGSDTTGVDLISIDGDRLVDPCSTPGQGCIRSHGGFVSYDDHIYLATGSSPSSRRIALARLCAKLRPGS